MKYLKIFEKFSTNEIPDGKYYIVYINDSKITYEIVNIYNDSHIIRIQNQKDKIPINAEKYSLQCLFNKLFTKSAIFNYYLTNDVEIANQNVVLISNFLRNFFLKEIQALKIKLEEYKDKYAIINEIPAKPFNISLNDTNR